MFDVVDQANQVRAASDRNLGHSNCRTEAEVLTGLTPGRSVVISE